MYRQYMNSLVPKYKYNTREGIHIVGKMIFDYAIEMEFLQKNPTDNYMLPKNLDYDENEQKLIFLEKEELIQFLQIAKQDGLANDYEFFSLLAFSGMRIGEAILLQWKDIDFVNNSISINKTYFNPSNNKRKFEIQTLRPAAQNEKFWLIHQLWTCLQLWKWNKSNLSQLQLFP